MFVARRNWVTKQISQIICGFNTSSAFLKWKTDHINRFLNSFQYLRINSVILVFHNLVHALGMQFSAEDWRRSGERSRILHTRVNTFGSSIQHKKPFLPPNMIFSVVQVYNDFSSSKNTCHFGQGFEMYFKSFYTVISHHDYSRVRKYL